MPIQARSASATPRVRLTFGVGAPRPWPVKRYTCSPKAHRDDGGLAMSLATPERIRILQRRLYVKARRNHSLPPRLRPTANSIKLNPGGLAPASYLTSLLRTLSTSIQPHLPPSRPTCNEGLPVRIRSRAPGFPPDIQPQPRFITHFRGSGRFRLWRGRVAQGRLVCRGLWAGCRPAYGTGSDGCRRPT